MRKLMSKRWTLLGLTAVIFLAACTGAGDNDETVVEETAVIEPTDAPSPTDEPIAEPEPTVVEVVETAVSEESEQPDESEETGEEENDPVTENEDDDTSNDDRSDRLRSLTSSWNTNWNLHSIDYADILSGGPPRDGIPSIDDPQFISIEEAAEWLADNEPVVALEINGDARAYPLQVITWHEIVNDTVGDQPVVVTFCPLCNSAIVFDRVVEGEAVEFGVSGLLRNSDLIMYDRTDESLWQQFTGTGIVGNHTGKQLTFLASSLVSFADFKGGFPDGVVLSRDTGNSRSYGDNPYAGYDTYDNPLSSGGDLVLFSGEKDDRLDAADRVVTVALDGIDVAYPLAILAEAGVIDDTQGGQELVVFHIGGTASALGARVIADGEDVGATGVFDPNLDGQRLTFTQEDDHFVDAETGSSWNILGQAFDGELAEQQLTPIIHADHFWFSWAAFKPDTIIYQP